MASEEAQYSSDSALTNNKRKYDDGSPPATRRPTGFSAPILPDSVAVVKPPPSSYNSVPPLSDIESAKLRAQEIAARIYSSAEAKRPKNDSSGFDSPVDSSSLSTMASEEAQYSSDSAGSPPEVYRPTGFSMPILPDSAAVKPPPSSYNSVPPLSDIESAKLRAQEIAARIYSSAEAKRPKNDSSGFDSPVDTYVQKPPMPSFTPPTYGYQGNSMESKAIDIPSGKVGVIIGKGGETIKQLQAQSGAKIQVTRDMDADPYSTTRKVDLTGTADQIVRAEQLIKDVLAEAETGGSGAGPRRTFVQQPGAEQYVTKIPNNKVGLVIGKGGETIKNMQAQSNARIQVIPLHLPPGDPATERTLQIDGTAEQIEIAKQLVNEVISENRVRNPSMGGYSQQGYQARPPTSWTPPVPQMQQPAYGGYMQQQPGAYPTGQTQYNNTSQQYPGYPPQPASGGYSTGWDQTTGAPTQQQQNTQGGTGYDASAYGYPQQSGYNQQGQSYSQDGYNYNQPQTNSTQGYDQNQAYGSAPSYGAPNPTATTDGAQGDNTTTNQAPPPAQQAPAPVQQGYGTTAPQPGYGVPPTSQPGYGTQPSYPGYGAPAQYGQGGYGAAQLGYGPPPPYGAPPAAQPGYSQQQPQYNSSYGGGGYAQPPAYSADANAAPTSQAVPPTGVTQASPQS